MDPAADEATPLTRRARYRQATVEEIKTLAKKQLAEQGPGSLSLRAIAREMGTASSALYRYFANQDELISALCADAYESVADALEGASEAERADDHAGRWWAICHAYRRWSLENPADFALIFGTPLPGYRAPKPATGPAAARLISVLLKVFAAAVESGAADPDDSLVLRTLEIGELLQDLLDRADVNCPPRLAGSVLNAWVSLLGYLAMETFGSLPRLISDPGQLFAVHVRLVMLGMGFKPADIDAADLRSRTQGRRAGRKTAKSGVVSVPPSRGR